MIVNKEVVFVYQQLISNLEEQIKNYRSLLEVVRREKDILISAQLDDLNENNKLKESLLIKLRDSEAFRVHLMSDLVRLENLSWEKPRLNDLASHFGGEAEERLRSLHSVLELLVKRIQEYNRKNDILVHSALEKITGAMRSVRDHLKEKSVYQSKGQILEQTPQSGQLVSKEV